MTKRVERRKVYLIDRKIQFSFLRSLVIAIVIVSIFFGYFLIKINDHLTETLIMQYSGAKVEMSLDIPITQDVKATDLRDQLKKRDMLFLAQILLVILLMGLLVGFYAIRFSHRIAGPVYRIKESFRQALEGDYSVRIVLRKRDFMKDVADQFNKLMESLDKK